MLQEHGTALAVAGVSMVTLILSGMGWMIKRWFSRSDQLEKFREKIMVDVQVELDRCETAHNETKEKLDKLTERMARVAILETTIYLAADALIKADAKHPAIPQIAVLLLQAIPFDATMPPQLDKLIRKIEEVLK